MSDWKITCLRKTSAVSGICSAAERRHVKTGHETIRHGANCTMLHIGVQAKRSRAMQTIITFWYWQFASYFATLSPIISSKEYA